MKRNNKPKTKTRKIKKYPFKTILLFSSLVFAVLVLTMSIVGVLLYAIYKRDTIGLASIETISTLIIFFIVASVILGTVISVLLGSLFLKDFDDIINGMNYLSQGQYDVRIEERKGGTSELINSFNRLANELENTDTLRKDFINEYAHEFKTPIASLLGFAKILGEENLSKEQQIEYIKIIQEEAQRLSTLSTNSLALTRIENQDILTGETKFNLSEQIRKSILILENKWSRKDLDLNVELDELEVYANEEMLKQVWINIIDNAIKFSFDKQPLEIKLYNKENSVIFEITNIGKPILEEDRENLFNSFYRSQSVKNIEGTGIGLAIVSKIISLHEGSINFESVDNKTKFIITLPNREE